MTHEKRPQINLFHHIFFANLSTYLILTCCVNMGQQTSTTPDIGHGDEEPRAASLTF